MTRRGGRGRFIRTVHVAGLGGRLGGGGGRAEDGEQRDGAHRDVQGMGHRKRTQTLEGREEARSLRSEALRVASQLAASHRWFEVHGMQPSFRFGPFLETLGLTRVTCQNKKECTQFRVSLRRVQVPRYGLYL